MNRVKFLGYEISVFSFDNALDYALELEMQDNVSQIVTINPEMIDCANRDGEFSKILQNAEVLLPDGIGVTAGLKILGYNTERIAGIDFAWKMLELSAKNNLPIAIIGSKPEVIKKTKENLLEKIANLNIVYSHDGYFNDDNAILEELKCSSPRLILVALGSPKQEKFIYKAKSILPFGLMIGVGGSFDVWSGMIKRAPAIYQKCGLEWLYRTVKQPERFYRIFPTMPLFILKVLKERIIREVYKFYREK